MPVNKFGKGSVSVTIVQKAIDQADERQLIAQLAVVIAWECRLNDPADMLAKMQAQERLIGILYADRDRKPQELERARKFLHDNSETIAALGGF